MRKRTAILFFYLITQFGFAQLDFISNKKFTHCDSLRGTLSSLRSCYDVLMYDLDIKVEIEKKFISGSNTIKLLATSNFNSIQIDLFQKMSILKITWNNLELKYMRDCNAVFVKFPLVISANSVQTIKIEYEGNPQTAKNPPWDGGFSWEKDNDGNPFVGVSCQGTGASLWYPCKDHQSDEPNEMLIRVSVPDGLDEVSNGRLKRKTKLENGYTKFEWYVANPINNYNVTLNIAKYKHFSDYYFNPESKDSLSLDYYVLPQNFEKAQKQFQQVKPMLEAYYHYFGEYPFVADGYKLVESSYLGMEHQSCIAYGNKFKNGYLGYDRSTTGYKFDYIIIHESAHEWWGNSLTTNDIADMWIHEGFGTYAEALYIEYLYGHDAYLEYINSEKKDVNNDEPIQGVYNVNNEASSDMYPKGALLLHTIRSVINDDKKFFSILRGIQKEFKCRNVNADDVENYFNEFAGIDLSQIFDLYLKKTVVAILDVFIYRDFIDWKAVYSFKFINKITGEYDIIMNASKFTMPVKVTTEKNKFNFIHPIAGEEQEINLHFMNPDDFKIATDYFYIESVINIERNQTEH